MYDVIIIGSGITGSSIARELSRYNLKTLVLEKDNDVANGTTKANSAIVHAGYDATPGTLKARFNVRGNEIYETICKDLSVPFKRIGSLVVAFNDDEMKMVKDLYDRGIENNVPDMEIIGKDRVLELEPNLRDEVAGALYAKTGGIVGPWELSIAMLENAAENGVEVLLNTEVTKIEKNEDTYIVYSNEKKYNAKLVINCAGLYSDEINNMVNEPLFEIVPNKGEYNLFDKSVGDTVNTVVFRCPSKDGKGAVILPTVHGNLLIGPTAEYVDDKKDLSTSWNGLVSLEKHTKETLKNSLSFGTVITSFSGLRAKTASQDFIIEESKSKGFINVAAIDSPGLTAAPAIAEYVMEIVKGIFKDIDENRSFNGIRRPSIHFADLSQEEKAKLIEQDDRFGRVICRCEHITEGEIVDVAKRKVGATTLDGVKRRARPGGGRCQGGFCAPRVMEILAKEMDVDITEVLKDGKGSYILTGKTK